MATEWRGGWCEPFGPDAWDYDAGDERCDNGAAFRVTATVEPSWTGIGGTASLDTCVRHVGYAAAILLTHGEVTVKRIDD